MLAALEDPTVVAAMETFKQQFSPAQTDLDSSSRPQVSSLNGDAEHAVFVRVYVAA